MEKKQTAVEYLVEQLESIGFSINDLADYYNEVKIALEMEKEQHEETWFSSRVEDMGDEFKVEQKSFDDYYNETYGGQDESK